MARPCCVCSGLCLNFAINSFFWRRAGHCHLLSSCQCGMLLSPLLSPSTAIPPVLQRRGSTWREPSWEREPAPGAVPAPPERMLPPDHLVQHDAQGPDGRCLAVVPAEVRPFRGAVGRCSYGIEMEFFRGTLPAPRASPQHPWARGGRSSGTRRDPLPSRQHLGLVYKLGVGKEAAGVARGQQKP